MHFHGKRQRIPSAKPLAIQPLPRQGEVQPAAVRDGDATDVPEWALKELPHAAATRIQDLRIQAADILTAYNALLWWHLQVGVPFHMQDPAVKSWALAAPGHVVLQQAPLDTFIFVKLVQLAEHGTGTAKMFTCWAPGALSWCLSL